MDALGGGKPRGQSWRRGQGKQKADGWGEGSGSEQTVLKAVWVQSAFIARETLAITAPQKWGLKYGCILGQSQEFKMAGSY